jgi:hypothetical protein
LQVIDMATAAPASTRQAPSDLPHRPSARQRRRERRRLAERDRISARLGELQTTRTLLHDAQALLAVGWIQDHWHSYRQDDMRHLEGRTVPGVCLVGAIVHAGRGHARIEEQVVQRTLDLVWHALYRGPDGYEQRTPPPAVRVNHLRDLAGWNDDRARTRSEVITLLDTSEALARTEAGHLAALVTR